MHYSWAMDLDPKVQHKFHVMLQHCNFYWCAQCHYNLAQGANSQVKDALDPALNRVGQELGWDFFLMSCVCVCLFVRFYLFVCLFASCLFVSSWEIVQAFSGGGGQGGADGVWCWPSWGLPGNILITSHPSVTFLCLDCLKKVITDYPIGWDQWRIPASSSRGEPSQLWLCSRGSSMMMCKIWFVCGMFNVELSQI